MAKENGSAPSSQVEQDIATIRKGLHLMLTNELKEADAFWEKSCAEAATRTIKPGERDPRGAFLFVGALTSLLHGVATLENNQLSEAYGRFQAADEKIDAEADWPGKTVLKGLSMLLMGVVQTLQKKAPQGVWLILRSWLWLRLLESDALPYAGPERSLVRSTALLALGIFNLIISLLPPLFMRTATWCSGLKGDRETAIGFLRTCWEEDGLLAPFAVVVLVGYEVDVRTFLGEPRTEDGSAEADKWLSWAEERFPSGLRANYFGVSRDVPRALEMSDSMAPMAEKLPALGLVMHARRAAYAQASLQWAKAAQACRDAMQVYRKVGRRSLVPAMAVGAALNHHLAGQKDEVEEMVSLALEYREKETAKKWDPPDLYAFRLADWCRAGTWDPELELFQLMTVRQRSTLFMSPADVEVLLSRLQSMGETDGASADRRCQCLFLQAEIHRQMQNFDQGLTVCAEGLALESKLSEENRKYGWIQYMHYVSAACHFFSGNLKDAKDSLRKLDACSKSHELYFPLLFKTTQLNRRLGVEIKDTYLEISVSNRSKLTLEAAVPADVEAVDWDFTLEEFSIGFNATFVAKDGTSTMLQNIEKYDSSGGPVTGRFEPTSAGKLLLTFDNSFSILRGKTLLVRVQPDYLVLSPQ